ncbi:hypothetical protein HUU62_04350 [Rhodoferax sp. 4810]|nr:hypothetical protein [Rhodoferax jenense]
MGAIPGLPTELPGLPALPPLNLNFGSRAESGDISTPMAWDSSGFSVNYGNGVSQGGAAAALPAWVWPAALVLGVVLWKKTK